MEKKLYGKHSNGETVEFEVMGVVDSATWNAYKRGECGDYVYKDKEIAERAKNKWQKYAERERKQRTELNAVNTKLHTALKEVKERIGGKGEVVICIGKDAVTLVPNEAYVDTDVISKKYRTTNAEEKRGINRMKTLIGYYRRKLRLEKSLARTMYYKTRSMAEYKERGGYGFTAYFWKNSSELYVNFLKAEEKYLNFEKNKNNITVQYMNYKVDKKKIYVGYLKKCGYDYLAFDNYKEYSDYEKLWYEERGLTNWRMRDYRRKKPKTDVKPILLLTLPTVQDAVQNPPKRRGRPRGSKNKKKIAASA